MGRNLKNKPLVEAILELQWQLTSVSPGVENDPNYPIVLGRFSERVEKQYPFHEPLQLAGFPDELTGHRVQHRFRVGEDRWPLLQLGPGILTVNDTGGYEWKDFEHRCVEAIDRFLDAYPNGQAPQAQKLTLRYINAVPFNFRSADVLEYMGSHLKTTLRLQETFFEKLPIQPMPTSSRWNVSFPLKAPVGTVAMKLGTGFHREQPAVVWETLVISDATEAPNLGEGFETWIDQAHGVAETWFFELVEGELLRRFEGE